MGYQLIVNWDSCNYRWVGADQSNAKARQLGISIVPNIQEEFRKITVSLIEWHKKHLNDRKAKLDDGTSAAWRQRFFTSLAVGNGGGMAASWSLFIQDNAAFEQAAARALQTYGVGVIAASLIPVFLWWGLAHPIFSGTVQNEPADRMYDLVRVKNPVMSWIRGVSYFLIDRAKLVLAAISSWCFFQGLITLQSLVSQAA